MVDEQTGAVTYFRVCKMCEESFRREEWAVMTEQQRSVFPVDWCYPTGVDRDIRRQARGDRWNGTFESAREAVQEVRLEDVGVQVL